SGQRRRSGRHPHRHARAGRSGRGSDDVAASFGNRRPHPSDGGPCPDQDRADLSGQARPLGGLPATGIGDATRPRPRGPATRSRDWWLRPRPTIVLRQAIPSSWRITIMRKLLLVAALTLAAGATTALAQDNSQDN